MRTLPEYSKTEEHFQLSWFFKINFSIKNQTHFFLWTISKDSNLNYQPLIFSLLFFLCVYVCSTHSFCRYIYIYHCKDIYSHVYLYFDIPKHMCVCVCVRGRWSQHPEATVNILVDNTNINKIASTTCKKMANILEALLIKKKKPALNNINYEHRHNVLKIKHSCCSKCIH